MHNKYVVSVQLFNPLVCFNIVTTLKVLSFHDFAHALVDSVVSGL